MQQDGMGLKQIVDLDVVGSNPITRPNYFSYSILNSCLERIARCPGASELGSRAAQEFESRERRTG